MAYLLHPRRLGYLRLEEIWPATRGDLVAPGNVAFGASRPHTDLQLHGCAENSIVRADGILLVQQHVRHLVHKERQDKRIMYLNAGQGS